MWMMFNLSYGCELEFNKILSFLVLITQFAWTDLSVWQNVLNKFLSQQFLLVCFLF
jgi:hypothetical protein